MHSVERPPQYKKCILCHKPHTPKEACTIEDIENVNDSDLSPVENFRRKQIFTRIEEHPDGPIYDELTSEWHPHTLETYDLNYRDPSGMSALRSLYDKRSKQYWDTMSETEPDMNGRISRFFLHSNKIDFPTPKFLRDRFVISIQKEGEQNFFRDSDELGEFSGPKIFFHSSSFITLPEIFKFGLLSVAIRNAKEYKDVTQINLQVIHDSSKKRRLGGNTLNNIGKHYRRLEQIFAECKENISQEHDPNMAVYSNEGRNPKLLRLNQPNEISIWSPYLKIPMPNFTEKRIAIGKVTNSENSEIEIKEKVEDPDLGGYPQDTTMLPENDFYRPTLILENIKLSLEEDKQGNLFLSLGGGLSGEMAAFQRVKPSSIKALCFNISETKWHNDHTQWVSYKFLTQELPNVIDTLEQEISELQKEDMHLKIYLENRIKFIRILQSNGFTNLLDYYKSFGVPVYFSFTLNDIVEKDFIERNRFNTKYINGRIYEKI